MKNFIMEEKQTKKLILLKKTTKVYKYSDSIS